MDVRRSINTKMWADEWFESLKLTDKLLWMYLLTNQYTNMLGIYEVSLKRISFETGLNQGEIERSLEAFERVRKCYYRDGWVVLCNWMKNQSMNTNMIKSARNRYEALPNSLIKWLEGNGSEGFERLSKGLVTLRKKEKEKEKEKEIEKNDFDIFWNKYDKKTGREKTLSKWKKLTGEERKKAMAAVPGYVQATPDKKYRKNPLTWLNGKHWEDEETIGKIPEFVHYVKTYDRGYVYSEYPPEIQQRIDNGQPFIHKCITTGGKALATRIPEDISDKIMVLSRSTFIKQFKFDPVKYGI